MTTTPTSAFRVLLTAAALLASPFALTAADDAAPAAPAAAECAIDGNPADARWKTEYEGKTYGFCSEECLQQFEEERSASLYQRIGGDAALTAAVDLFYVKVLADDRVNFFFEDINMHKQRRHQKAFLAAALGAPTPWTGKDLRKAHAHLDLREEDFAAIAENLQATLVELKLDEALIDEVMAIVASTKDDVLNKAKSQG